MKERFAIWLLLGGMLWLLGGCGSLVESSFYVEGACEACKEVIEATLSEQPGVESAVWSFSSSQVQVSFRSSITNEEALQEILAAKGFHTRFFDANPQARKQLPACCQESLQRKLEQPAIQHSAHP